MRGSDRSLVCAIRGPITLITVGVLFALNNFTPYGFHQTWPVLLIVFGLLTPAAAQRGARRRRPSDPQDIRRRLPLTLPAACTGAGGYRQSQYPAEPAPPAGPAKGGFGSTAGGAIASGRFERDSGRLRMRRRSITGPLLAAC